MLHGVHHNSKNSWSHHNQTQMNGIRTRSHIHINIIQERPANSRNLIRGLARCSFYWSRCLVVSPPPRRTSESFSRVLNPSDEAQGRRPGETLGAVHGACVRNGDPSATADPCVVAQVDGKTQTTSPTGVPRGIRAAFCDFVFALRGTAWLRVSSEYLCSGEWLGQNASFAVGVFLRMQTERQQP